MRSVIEWPDSERLCTDGKPPYDRLGSNKGNGKGPTRKILKNSD